MLEVFTEAVLPVLILAGVGVIVGRTLRPDPRSVNRLALFVFSPALIFSSLASTEIVMREIVGVVVFQAIWFSLFALLCWGIVVGSKFDPSRRRAFLLSGLFMNAVNYGFPVSYLAFGPEGLERAMLFLVPQAFLTGTVGVYMASGGLGSWTQGFREILKTPLIYAVVLALVVNPFDVTFPSFVAVPLELMGLAAIPTMLMVLGMQLAQASLRQDLLPASAATGLRLVIAPALAYGVTIVLGMGGVLQKVVIVLSGMPTAVHTTILATEFNTDPRLVTSTVALSTCVSLITLSILIWLVQRLG